MTTLLDLARTIGLHGLIGLVAALAVVLLIVGKLAFGRLTPTLCVLLVGVPAAYLLGRATSTLARTPATSAGGRRHRAPRPGRRRGHHRRRDARRARQRHPHLRRHLDGSCVVCGEHTHHPATEDKPPGIDGRWPHECPFLHRVGRVV